MGREVVGELARFFLMLFLLYLPMDVVTRGSGSSGSSDECLINTIPRMSKGIMFSGRFDVPNVSRSRVFSEVVG